MNIIHALGFGNTPDIEIPEKSSSPEIEEKQYFPSDTLGSIMGMLGYNGSSYATLAARNPFALHAWSHAASSIVGRMVMQVPFLVVKDDLSLDIEEREVVTDPNNPWVKLFRRPNPYTTWRKFIQSLVIEYDITGEAFIIPRDALFDQKMQFGQMPGTLEIPNSKCLTVQENRWGYPAYWDHNRNTVQEQLKINEVVWIYSPTTTDRKSGLSGYDVGKENVKIDSEAHEFNKNFFLQGANLAGYLTWQKSSEWDRAPGDDEMKEMARRFRNTIVGSKNNGKIPYTKGLKYEKLGTTQKDMDFKSLMEWLREEITALSGVPKTKLSSTDKIDRSTAKVMEKQIWTDKLIPLLQDVESAINTTIMMGSGFNVIFDFSGIEALQDDRVNKIEGAKVLQEMGYPLNDINKVQKLGMPSVEEPWGDEAVNVNAKAPEPVKNEPAKKEITAGESTVVREAPHSDENEIQKATNDEWHALYERTVIDNKNTKDYGRKITNYYNKLQKEQMRLIEDAKSAHGLTKDVIDEYLFDPEEWGNKFAVMSAPFQATAMETVGVFTAKEIELSNYVFRLDNPNVTQIMTEKAILSKEIPVRFHDELRTIITDTLDSGRPLSEAADQMRDAFSTKKKTAFDTARTEVAQSTGKYRHDLGKTSPNLRKLWVDAKDSVVRKNHAKFGRTGPKRMNYEYVPGLKHPSDMNGPVNEIINCRCYERFVRA